MAEGIVLGGTGECRGSVYHGKGLLPLGMQKTWSGCKNLERVSRELLFGARVAGIWMD